MLPKFSADQSPCKDRRRLVQQTVDLLQIDLLRVARLDLQIIEALAAEFWGVGLVQHRAEEILPLGQTRDTRRPARE